MGICSGRYTEAVRLDGMTAIVTGCNTGIGKPTVKYLYASGCRVIMACRDLAKATAAREDIEAQCRGEMADRVPGLGGVGQLEVRHLDLSSLASVRQFARHTMKHEPRIQLLINNAGIMMCPQSKTVDGFELQFGTNHLGHFLLTLLLLPRIIASAPARIVNVSSILHTMAGEIDWDSLNAEKSYSPTKQYALSKLANVLFTKELARRLQVLFGEGGVTVYAAHPGVVKTDLSRHFDEIIVPGASWFYSHIGGVLQKDEVQGAATTLYCAVDPETAGETGLYYADMKAIPCHPDASDPHNATRLWKLSEEMVQLDPNFDPYTPSQYVPPADEEE